MIPYDVQDALWTGKISIESDQLQVFLLGESYQPDPSHSSRDDLKGSQVFAPIDLTGVAVIRDKSDKYLVADNLEIELGGFVAFRYAVVLDATAGILLAYEDFGDTVNATRFSLAWDDAGILKI